MQNDDDAADDGHDCGTKYGEIVMRQNHLINASMSIGLLVVMAQVRD